MKITPSEFWVCVLFGFFVGVIWHILHVRAKEMETGWLLLGLVSAAAAIIFIVYTFYKNLQ